MPRDIPSVPPCRILAAEDVATNRAILRAGLERLGHHVEFAVNGAEAIDKLQAGSFDLLLMDVQMPIMDGMEATRRIRMLAPPLCDIPIIALTANVLATQQRACIRAGMNECLAKPIDWDRLAHAIARYAGNPRGSSGHGAHALTSPRRTA
jgi:CheY-like chemotaxis protein